MSLGKRIRDGRERKGWTQDQLAEAFGVTRNAVSLWESDKSHPDSKKMAKLADLLDYTAHYLWHGREEDDMPSFLPKVPVVGYVGAGSAIEFEDAYPKGRGLGEVPCPQGLNPDKTIAVIVRGDSQTPMINDGWIIFYSRDPEPDAAMVVGKLSVVKMHEGPVMLKRVRRSLKRNRFNLESANAPIMEEVRLSWAAPVLMMIPGDIAKVISA